MKPYIQTQYANILIIILSLAAGYSSYTLLFIAPETPLFPLIIILLIFGVAILLFYRLRVLVLEDKIFLSFGIGLIWKFIDLKTIEKIDIVDIPFFYGRGIRITPKGTIYNLSSSRGLELHFKGSKRTVRIGSKDPEKLRSMIQERLNKNFTRPNR